MTNKELVLVVFLEKDYERSQILYPAVKTASKFRIWLPVDMCLIIGNHFLFYSTYKYTIHKQRVGSYYKMQIIGMLLGMPHFTKDTRNAKT